jgi:hypothetical protein
MRNALRRKKGPAKGEKSLSSFFLVSVFKLLFSLLLFEELQLTRGEELKRQAVFFAFPATSTHE